MAFDSLQEKLTKSFRNLQGKGKITEKNIEDTLQEVRVALLEADVNYRVVNDFLKKVKEDSLGKDVINAVEPSQLMIKIINDELIELLGSESTSLNYSTSGVSKIMVVGLQGTGKTTHVAKIAKYIKEKQNRKPLIIAADTFRLAAVEQLKTLSQEIGVEVYSSDLDKKVIILLTDGENNSGRLSLAQAIKLAKDENVKIYTIGVGAEKSLINSIFGINLSMPSGLDEESLAQIAKETQGSYFRAKNTQSLEKIYAEIDKLEANENEAKFVRDVQERFYIPLSAALLLSLFLFFWQRRRV